MTNPDDLKNKDLKEILSRLDLLEKRIAILESNKARIQEGNDLSEKETISTEEGSEYFNVNLSISSPFETKFGEYGLAWLGNIVLFFAIAFLLQYFNNAGRPLIAIILGVISIASVFTISHYFKKSFTYLSFTLHLFGFIILYYVVLRLHYYTNNPLITNPVIATLLLLIVAGILLYLAIRKQSQTRAILSFTLLLVTAYICSITLGFFLIATITAGLVLFSFWKYNWWKAMVYIVIISFLLNLIWLIKNSASPDKTTDNLIYYYAFVYFSITTAIYSLLALKKPNKVFPENLILSTILLSGITYSFLLLLLVFVHFEDSFVPFFAAISVSCITFSIVLKFYSPWEYTPALYALYGFVAISVVIFGIIPFPGSFLLLTLQSILVLTFALWYRSHIITLINTFLLIILMIIYYTNSGTLNTVNFAIPVVAFLSARIINWQKNRLNIKTYFIRNIYLFALFFSLLYGTFKGFPKQYITISWLCITGIYFMLSIILKNVKYRWMAIANLLVAAFYLFLVDMAKIGVTYRIFAFLIFAVITLVISTYYVRKLKKKGEDTTGEKNEAKHEI